MICQAHIKYDNNRCATDCEWKPVTELPRIRPQRWPFECVRVLEGFWGKVAVEVHGKDTIHHFSFDTPQEAGQIVAHYIGQLGLIAERRAL